MLFDVRSPLRQSRLLLFLVCAIAARSADRIGYIEFFGYKGLDLAAIRKAMPVHEGDAYSGQVKIQVRQALAAAIGKPPTDVAAICCDEKGNRLVFIGLPGASSKSFVYNPDPQGKERLPAAIMDLYSQLDHALEAAVRKGGDAAQEDDSYGYALVNDPDARSLQNDVRQWAVQHESELLRVLEFSFAVEHRRVASDALGYARQSHRQILALVHAARDPDDDVRNNATRALGVLARSKSPLAAGIPPDTFIEMLNSGMWTDRNKSASLLMELTAARNADLLAKIRAAALDSLIEMASWREAGHAYFARMVLGRVAGMAEERLKQLAWNGPVDPIIKAAQRPGM
jgi:hypothetical protein